MAKKSVRKLSSEKKKVSRDREKKTKLLDILGRSLRGEPYEKSDFIFGISALDNCM